MEGWFFWVDVVHEHRKATLNTLYQVMFCKLHNNRTYIWCCFSNTLVSMDLLSSFAELHFMVFIGRIQPIFYLNLICYLPLPCSSEISSAPPHIQTWEPMMFAVTDIKSDTTHSQVPYSNIWESEWDLGSTAEGNLQPVLYSKLYCEICLL